MMHLVTNFVIIIIIHLTYVALFKILKDASQRDKHTSPGVSVLSHSPGSRLLDELEAVGCFTDAREEGITTSHEGMYNSFHMFVRKKNNHLFIIVTRFH